MIWKLICGLSLLASQVLAVNFIVIAPRVCRIGIDCAIDFRLITGLPTECKLNIKIKDGAREIASMKDYTLPANTRNGTIGLQVPAGTPQKEGYNLTFSLVGTGIYYSNDTLLEIKSQSKASFIQTDKAIYKPSETVNFRVLCAKPDSANLKPCPETCKVDVQIYDPEGNKIRQWLQKTLQIGVFTEKLPLADKVLMGDWKIKAKLCDDSEIDKSFTVDEYRLPKFEVKVTLPPYTVANAPTLQYNVSAMYTYNKGVVGKLSVTVSIKYAYGYSKVFKAKDVKDFNGEFTGYVTKGDLMALNKGSILGDSQVIVVTAEVTERLTDLKESGNDTVKVYNNEIQGEFLSSEVYKTGSTYEGSLRLKLPNDSPVTKKWKTMKLTVRESSGGNTVSKTYLPSTVSQEDMQAGHIPFSFATEKFKSKINLNAEVEFDAKTAISVQKTVERFESYSEENVQVTIETQSTIKCGDKIKFKIALSQKTSLPFYYKATCRGLIIDNSEVNGDMGQLNSDGVAFLEIEASSIMSPTCRLIVYVIIPASDEIIADSVDFDVECDHNPVTVTFKDKNDQTIDKPVQPTGQDIQACAKAEPGSLVALLSIDESVLLLKSGNDITKQQVSDQMKLFDAGKNEDKKKFPFGCIRCKRSFFWPFAVGGVNTGDVFEKSGIVVITDAAIYSNPYPSVVTVRDGGFTLPVGGGITRPVPGVGITLPAGVNEKDESTSQLSTVAKHVRKFFPETWLWHQTIASSSGEFCFNTKVPDTITSWVTTAFAMSYTHGMGLTHKPTMLTVYRPFFVSLVFPVVIKRGENVLVKAIVFNYMSTKQKTLVTLEQSDDFYVKYDEKSEDFEDMKPKAQKVENRVEAIPGQGTLVQFLIIPQRLGEIKLKVQAQGETPGVKDIVERTLLIKPEGEEVASSQSALLDLTEPNAAPINKTFAITFPPAIVPGSQHAKLLVTGDLMGPTMDGLDKLLTVPMGCGEQNMLTMVPNIFVLKYLEAAGNVDAKVQAKATKHMESGYQRELTYKRKDNSFSAFGKRDQSGSIWLTAFVIKSFKQAKPFIYVDEEVLNKATAWLVRYQNRGGSFTEVGRVIHTEMLGGSAKDSCSLTAYVLIAMLEGSNPTSGTATADALNYLETTCKNIDDVYMVALLTYALHLADSSQKSTFFNKLSGLATRKGGMIYWEKAGEVVTPVDEQRRYIRHVPKSSNIEMTAYALLTYVLLNNADSLKIGKYLTAQSNGRGGFSSTQDTVVGLQAMAALAGSLGRSPTNLQVTIRFKDDNGIIASSTPQSIQMDSNDKEILRTREVPAAATRVEVEATGTGLALVTLVTKFNQVKDVDTDIKNRVVVKNDTQNSYIVNVCLWSTSQKARGMGLTEIKGVTGFESDQVEVEESVKYVRAVRRVEVDGDKTTLYIDEISNKTTTCFDVKYHRVAVVTNPKKASVTTIDYYNQEDQAISFYLPGASSASKLCDMCDACPGCNLLIVTVPPTIDGSTQLSVSFITVLATLVSILAVLNA